jgi:ABC-type sulfate transport system substrate-binding protein
VFRTGGTTGQAQSDVAASNGLDVDVVTLALNTDDQPAHVCGLTVAPHSYATDR